MRYQVIEISTGRKGTISAQNLDPKRFKVVGEVPENQPTVAASPQAEPQAKGAWGNLLSSIISNVISAPVNTARTIGAAGYEIPRTIKSYFGDNSGYLTPEGTAVKNPFLSNQETEQIKSDPLSFIGRQAGRSAALAAYGVPIGGTTSLLGKTIATTPFKGGALFGGLSSLDTDNPSLGGVALGAAGGGITASLINKILGAGKGASEVGAEMRQNIKNPKVKTSPLSEIKKAEIAKMGEKYVGSAKEQGLAAGQDWQALYDKVGEALKSSPVKISGEKLRESIRRAAKEAGFSGAEYTEKLEGLLSNLPKRDTNPFTIFSKVKNIVKRGEGGYGKADTASLTPQEQLVQIMDRITTNKIKSTVSVAKTGLNEMAKIQKLMPGLEAQVNKAQSGIHLPFIGNVGGEMAASRAQGLEDKLGLNLQNLAQRTSGLQKIAPVASNLGTKALIPGLVGENQQTQQASISELPTGGTSVGDQLDTYLQDLSGAGKKTGTMLDQITPETVALAYLTLPKSSADKLAAALKAKTPATGKLGATAQARIGYLATGLQGLNLVEQLYESNPNNLAVAMIPGQPLSRSWDNATFAAAEGLLRAFSGAAVPEDEVRRYASRALPSYPDDPATARQKIKMMRNSFNAMANALKMGASVEDVMREALGE